MDDKEKMAEKEAWMKENCEAEGNERKRGFIEDGRLWPYVVPINAFAEHIFVEYTDKLTEGVVVEYVNRDYDEFMHGNMKTIWLAKTVKWFERSIE